VNRPFSKANLRRGWVPPVQSVAPSAEEEQQLLQSPDPIPPLRPRGEGAARVDAVPLSRTLMAEGRHELRGSA